MSSATSRARSIASARTASATRTSASGRGVTASSRRSSLEVGRDGAQHRGNLAGLARRRVATAAQRSADAVEQLDQVLDDDGHLLGILALRLCNGARHRRQWVEHAQRQRLLAATALGDPELDPGAGLEGRYTSRQRGLVNEDVAALVLGEEAEALLRVVPLHLAAGHARPRPSIRGNRDLQPRTPRQGPPTGLVGSAILSPRDRISGRYVRFNGYRVSEVVVRGHPGQRRP